MNDERIQFPITVDNFTAYQEMLRGEPISHRAREALAAWVPVFNDSYRDGLENDLEALEQGVDRMNYIIEQRSTSPVMVKFLETVKIWIVYAWVRGRAAA